jgi:polyribonucleotide nucleotidyltransferase
MADDDDPAAPRSPQARLRYPHPVRKEIRDTVRQSERGGQEGSTNMNKDTVTRVAVDIAGTEVSFETGKMAKQASGAVVVRAGDTMVLCTATAGNLRDVDFLPLTVDVEERMYAAGKIPGSFFKREGRAGEKGTLTARMIDRPIRPLFPKGWRYETQLVAIPLSIDHVHPYDMLAMNGASAALMISEIPMPTPVGAVRIGKIDGNFVINPPEEDLVDNTDLDLIVAGTEDAILMVEAGANEIPEAEILDALDIAHEEIRKLCALQHELREKAGKDKLDVEVPQVDEDLLSQIKDSHGSALEAATQVEEKIERQDATKAVEQQILEQYAGDPDSDGYGERRAAAQMAFDKLEKSTIRERIAVQKVRPDGRAAQEIRDISIEVGVAPRTHGSALFTRGQTQALSVAALGTLREEMRLDTLGLETKKFYFHHYNFPPFSVGEAGFMRGPKRRDIGHGALAERALVPMIPSTEEFPYTIRVVSDILESNGSSSMASVCGSSLSLMDAGVPIKAPVAGIAMGLIKEGDDYIVLTDIAGVEDHLGDMDFKVAGTDRGITALQMDIKISGVTFEILNDALSQAKEARTAILAEMANVIDTPRSELSQYAPRIQTISIDPEKIGLLIGKGGETIRGLSEEFESQIDVNDEGQVLIYSANGELGDALAERIRSMTKEVEVGDAFDGKVVKTTAFGAFVELTKGTDGLLHISNVAPGEHPATVEEILNKGDEIAVRVVEVDRERGRIGLRLADDPEIAGKSPEELAAVGAGSGGGGARPRRDRDGRGGDRDGRGGGDRGERSERGSGRPRHRGPRS